MNTATGSILHVGLPVGDMERSLHFYGDILELAILSDREVSGERLSMGVQVPNARIRIVLLGGANLELELLHYLDPPGKSFDRQNNDVGACHVAFEVADIQATYERLRGLDVPCNNPPFPMSNRTGWGWFYARDPDGITVEFNGPLHPA